MSASAEEAPIEFREGEYGDRVAVVEPGGIEEIPDSDRHGSPIQLLWTWTSPNLEFATVFVGALGSLFLHLSVLTSMCAIVLGNGLGAIAHGVLSARGPAYGVPQMVLNRAPFGFLGNIFPAGIMSLTGGIGWFAVNSVSGTFALASLTKMSDWLALLIIVLVQVVVAFFGHNLVQAFERYAFPVLAIIFAVACIYSFTHSDPAKAQGGGGLGSFLLMTAAVYGYAAGWNPYAADYARYLPRDVRPRTVGLYAALGLFLSTTILESVGASAAATWNPDANPTTEWINMMPAVVGKLTLLAIVIGSIAANVLNIYSGSLAFLTLGFRLKAHLRRAIIAVVFGVAGFILAYLSLKNVGPNYENFLLVISYWLGPWLGVFFADQLHRKGARVDGLLFSRKHENWVAPLIFLVSLVVSVWLFSNQTQYTGPVPKHFPKVGDITFFVGFALSFFGYLALGRRAKAQTT